MNGSSSNRAAPPQATTASAADQAAAKKVVAGSAAKSLGLLGFFAITASMVLTVYEYPTFASSGFQLVFFLLVGGFLWFIPVALVAAEMATVKGWENGGIYAWVGNTLGKRWGFAALFFQWFQITVGFVTMAFFILAAFSYIVHWDALYNNPLVMFIGVAIIVWVLTFVQLGGTKYTARIAKAGFFGGIVIPAVVLFAGLIVYLATGHASQITMDWSTFIPDFSKVDTLVIFTSFILAFAGVEASASHVNELKNPGRNYPLAMFILVIVAIVLDALGGLAVAITLPANVLDGNLSYGVIEAFRQIFVVSFGEQWGWIVYAMAILLALGVLAEISSWIVGPSRALLDTAKEGILPPSFAKTNKNGVSVKTVMIQAVIVTIWDAVLCGSMALAGGSSSSVSYLTAIGLTVVIYLVAYVLLFVGYLVLVYKHKDLPRTYQIPGGKVFKTVVAVVGLLVTLGTLVVSFFPSSELSSADNMVYEATLIICFVISLAIPFVIYGLRKHWAPKTPQAPEVSAASVSGNATVVASPTTSAPATAEPTPRTPSDGGSGRTGA